MALVFLFAGTAQAQQGLGVLKFEYLDLDSQPESAVQCFETKLSNRLFNREGSHKILIVEILEDASFVLTYRWGLGKSFRCKATNESKLSRIVKSQFSKIKTESDESFYATLHFLSKEASGLITASQVEASNMNRLGKSAEKAFGQFEITSIKIFEDNPYSEEVQNTKIRLRDMVKDYARLSLIDKVIALIMMENKIPTASYQID